MKKNSGASTTGAQGVPKTPSGMATLVNSRPASHGSNTPQRKNSAEFNKEGGSSDASSGQLLMRSIGHRVED